ncbi:obscurin-like [Spinachia spinachia]
MRAIRRLLLLAEFVLLARCQQKPQVDTSPQLGTFFLGDLFLVTCGSSGGSEVKWYLDGTEQAHRTRTWKIPAAAPQHSGRYRCGRDGQMSDDYSIAVQGYAPKALLFIRSGQHVVQREGSVLLQLHNEDGVKGWRCWVNAGEHTSPVDIRKAKEKAVSVVFQTHRLNVQESVFWCNATQQLRSNQVQLRTSVSQKAALVMYPLPAVVGANLTLRCLAWGADNIIRVAFYKNDVNIQESQRETYQINNVTESAAGRYKGEVTYAYEQHTTGPPYHTVSDDQDVFVQVSPMWAVLDVSAGSSMTCSCGLCPANSTYRWYKIDNGETWPLPGSPQRVMTPEASGTYACRAVWAEGRSLLSRPHIFSGQSNPTPAIVGVSLVVVGLVIASVGFCIHRKRNTPEQVYEDVPLRSRDTADGGYEALRKGPRGEAEYDTLRGKAPGDKGLRLEDRGGSTGTKDIETRTAHRKDVRHVLPVCRTCLYV